MGETTYQLAVDGMTCAHCEAAIIQALTETGALQVAASFRQGTATFQARGDLPGESFRAAVRAVGYTPGALTVLHRAGTGQPAPGPITTGARRAAGYDLAIIGSGGAAMAAAI